MFTSAVDELIVRWLIAVCATLAPLNCYAYIDPNAGGWLFQLLFPLLVAIGGAWMVVRRRVSALWNRLFQRKREVKDGD